jgi:amidohydrolase
MNSKILIYKKELDSIAEVGWNELKTTRYIKDTLLAKPLRIGFGNKKVGILYEIGHGSKAILLRADIDALQTKNGIKHICGHSSHVAALMAAFIYKYKDIIKQHKKTVYFLFQPAEETYPSGAKTFLDECSSIIPKIKYAFAAHVRPKLPLHTLGLLPMVVGRGDYMEFSIHGKMVHVKNAPLGIDALEAASHIVLFVKHLQKRFEKHLRINIGVALAGLQPNAVPGYALLKGDIRMKNDKYQDIIKKLLRQQIDKIEKKVGATIDFKYFDGYPPLVNDKKLIMQIAGIMRNTTRLKLNFDKNLFTFGSEDFSFIANKIPSVYALIGTGNNHDIHEEQCTISDEGTIDIYTYFKQIISWWLQ